MILLLSAAALGGVIYLIRDKNSELTAARRAIVLRDFERASEHLNRYLDRHPDDAEALLLAAQTARRKGNFQTAHDRLKRCQQNKGLREPIDLEFRLLEMQSGKLGELRGLMAVADESPHSPETALVLEAVAVGTLNAVAPLPGPTFPPHPDAIPYLPEARRAADLWLELRTGRADRVAGLVWRGRIRALAGEHAAGVADLREALRLDPQHFDARIHLAFLIAPTNPHEAVEHFAYLRDRDPSNLTVRFALATAYRDVGRIDEAKELLDGILVDEPDEVSILLARGNIALDRLQLADAERDLLRAYRLDPRQPEVSLALSQCMHLSGQPTKAKEYRERFLRLNEERKERARHPVPKP